MTEETTAHDYHDYVVERQHGPATLIDGIAPEWTALCAEGPCNEPFYYPAWAMAYLTAFEPRVPITLITVRRDGALRAVLPLTERSIGVGPLRLRWLRATANSHFTRFDIIHGANDGDIVAREIWTYLKNWKGWDVLHIESAPKGGVAWRLLALAGTSGHPTRLHRPDASPYLDLTEFPGDIDDIISSVPKNLRSQIRRSLKRLRSQAEVEFRIVDSDSTAPELENAVETLYHVEASGWKGRAGTAILDDQATKRFYDQVIADGLTKDSLAIGQLRCGGHVVATELCLVWNGTMYQLKAGYDEAFSKWSPGHLFKAHVMAAATADGIEVLDNCGRADPHKVAWTSLSRPFAACFIGNNTFGARAAWTVLFRAGPMVRTRLKNMPIPGFVHRLLG